MIRIAICDDSPAFLRQSKYIIDHWDAPAACNITCEMFEDGDSLLASHLKNPFDIVLLDIIMPMLNGIETAREMRQKDRHTKIVFLTSSPEYAVESYTVKASNYLLKPLDPAKLFECLSELISEINAVGKYLTVRGLDATHRLPLSSIEFVESQSKHIILYTVEGKTVMSTEPLYTYENTLTLKDGFFKCHRSYIVNVHNINSYSSTEIVMQSSRRVPISRSHQKAFEDIYFSVVFEEAGDEL